MGDFYLNTSDTNLVNDFLLTQPDIYIMKHERESTGVFTLSTAGNDSLYDSAATFTPSGLISTVGLNMMIRDDNNKLAYGKIISNTATTLTFQAADMRLFEDGTTAPTLTAGATYSYRVLSASSQYAFGDFLGYCNNLTFASEPDVAEFKYSIPRQKIREDLLENVQTVNGNVFSTKPILLKTIYGMTTYGLQTGQVEYHAGSTSFATSYYQIAMKGVDVNNRAVTLVFFKTKVRNSGELNFSEEGYKMFPFTCPVFADTLRDSTQVNHWMYRRAN